MTKDLCFYVGYLIQYFSESLEQTPLSEKKHLVSKLPVLGGATCAAFRILYPLFVLLEVQIVSKTAELLPRGSKVFFIFIVCDKMHLSDFFILPFKKRPVGKKRKKNLLANVTGERWAE